MSVLFSGEETSVINRKLNVTATRTDNAVLKEKYELSRCCKWIESRKYQRIALQFPDELLPDAFEIANYIEGETGKVVFVLGDTSYGSCCADEVAAEHGSADALIHFGRACLTPTIRLPILYVFGFKPISCQKAAEQCINYSKDKTKNIIVICDVFYAYALAEIGSLLKPHFSNVIVSELDIPQNKDDDDAVPDDNSVIKKCGRKFCLPNDITLKDCYFFYIGEENLTQANIFLTFNNCNLFSYDPLKEIIVTDALDIGKTLGRRYYLVEKTKDAKIIGILVGTLGITHYLTVIKHLKSIIKASGKRSYTLVFGKPNPAKLANFSEIDVFVLVACSENSLLDSRDYYRPIITPFELEVALNKNRSWDGQYITNFAEILCGGSNYTPHEVWDVEVMDMSLVSGRMRKMGTEYTEEQEGIDNVLEIRDSMTVAPVHREAAGEHLAARSWKGLEQKLGEVPVEMAKEGQKGLAAGYNNEGS